MKLLVVAGEASGDTHGAALLKGLKENHPEIDIYGIGGPKMLREGLRPYYMMDALQVHGLAEVLFHLPRLYQILWNLRDSLIEEEPDAVLLIDYPGFNLKLAAYAKKFGIPVLFFNSPQIWAWRKGRLKTIVQVVDKMMVLFPFEKEIYTDAGMDADFVGHPLLDESVPEFVLQEFRAQYGFKKEIPLIVLAPGSRPSELKNHLPVMLEALPLLEEKIGEAQYLLPLAESLDIASVQRLLDDSQKKVLLISGSFAESIRTADAAIVASGTATLQTGLALTPFVIVYKVANLSFWIAKKLAQVPYLGIVNVLAKRCIVPELLQERFTPANIAEKTAQILQDNAYRQQMLADLKAIRHQLGEAGAYTRSVSLITEFLSH